MEQIICSCGHEIFVPFGDENGYYTDLECFICDKLINLVKTKQPLQKLLSIYGEDYCRAYRIDRGTRLVFTEYGSVTFIINKPLRYNIAERLDSGNRIDALAIRRYIIDTHNIGTTTWHDWLKIRRTDKRDIPSVVLRDIAKMLDVPMEELFNN